MYVVGGVHTYVLSFLYVVISSDWQQPWQGPMAVCKYHSPVQWNKCLSPQVHDQADCEVKLHSELKEHSALM